MNNLAEKKHIIVSAMLLIVAVMGMIIAMNRTDTASSEEKLLQAQEYFDIMDYDKVVAIYNDIISSDRSCAEAYIGLAEIYYLRGNSDKAFEMLERGVNNTGGDDKIEKKISEMFPDGNIKDIQQAEMTEAEDITPVPDESAPPETVSAVSENAETEVTSAPPAAETEETTTVPTTAEPVAATTAPPATTAAAPIVTTAKPATVTTAATTVTTAAPKAVVPDFLGMSRSNALTTAKNNGITLSVEYESDVSRPNDTVLRQSAAAGTEVEKDSSVTIYVCKFDQALLDFYNAASVWGGENDKISKVALDEKNSSVTVTALSSKKLVIDETVMAEFKLCSGATLCVVCPDVNFTVRSSGVSGSGSLDLSSEVYGNENYSTVGMTAAKGFNCTVTVTVKNSKIADFSSMSLYKDRKKIGDVSLNQNGQPEFTVTASGGYTIK